MAETKNSNGDGKKQLSSSKHVQLTRNFNGHQYGETFTEVEADKAGVLEHCVPFKKSTDREVKGSEKTG